MKTLAKQIAALIVTIGALIAAIYGASRYIDSRIATALNEPNMVRRIAFAARPEMIIDQKGTIEIDHGAMDYIADIKVTQNPQSAEIADTIVITPKRYMAHPPLVTSVEGGLAQAKTERGQKLDWIIKLEYASSYSPGPNRLRIEIIDR